MSDATPPPTTAPGSAHELGRMRYPEVQALLAASASSVAIIPAGSVEAHGPHLPLSTDTMISTEVARRAAQQLADAGWTAIVFPPVHYGVTDWAASFAGTTSIPADVTHGLFMAAAHAARDMGFTRVAITNAHLEPGHIMTLRKVSKDFEAATGSPLVFSDKTRRVNAEQLTEEFRSGSCHAGQYETSLILAIDPSLVRRDVAQALPEHHVALHEKIAAGAKDFAECGLSDAYCGKPGEASAEEGERTLSTLSTMVADAVLASVPPSATST